MKRLLVVLLFVSISLGLSGQGRKSGFVTVDASKGAISEQVEWNKRTSLKGIVVNGSPTLEDIKYINSLGIATVDLSGTTLKTIAEKSFEGNETLVSVVLPSGLLSIGHSAFSGCVSLSSVVLAEGLKKIDVAAFSLCKSLGSITLPESLQEIGTSAFNGCSSLASIVVPTGVKTIGEGAFNDCSSLAKVVIKGSISEVPKRAFSGCTALAEIALPSTVTLIEQVAFSDCTSLRSMTILAPEPPKAYTEFKYHYYTFKGCPKFMLYVPKGSAFKYDSSNWKSVVRQIVEKN